MKLLKSLVIALALAAGAAAPAAMAHHSFAMFDRERPLTLVGTIKAFQWTNPHSWIQIDAPDDKGVVKERSVLPDWSGVWVGANDSGWDSASMPRGGIAGLPGSRIYDYVCTENNWNPITASGQTLTLGTDGKSIDKTVDSAGK